MADRPNVEEVFEAWAHVAARVRKRSPEDQKTILSGLGIGPEWQSVHETWSKRLNDDIVGQQMDRPKRYAQICREEQLRRQRAEASRASAPPPATEAVPQGFGSDAPPLPPGGSGPPPPIPEPLRPAVVPPMPIPAPNVQLGISGSPVLGVSPQNADVKPMRRRAETLDLKDPPPGGDAVPFGKQPRGSRQPAATQDFRDLVTPQRVKPNFPWMMQEHTTGAIAGAATDVGPGARNPPVQGAGGDFRRDLGVEKRPTMPRPNQNDTASGVDLAATVEAARQVSDVMSWTVERWARLIVSLERQPQNADALWLEQGITSSEARMHAASQWQRRLDKEPSVKAEMIGHLERLRALP